MRTIQVVRADLFLIFILLLYNMNISLCQGALFSVDADVDSHDIDITYGPSGSPERIVSINKDLIHKQESHLPTENRCIFVEIKFFELGGDDWKIKDLVINEFIDKDLVADPSSVRCTIISNLSDINKYKTNLAALKNSIAIGSINEHNFSIVIPGEFDSDCRILFWYNVTVKKPGAFELDTIVISNPKINIYYDVEKTLTLHVDNYDIITPFFSSLNKFIWILIVLSGIFTFYKQIIQKEIDPESYHINDFLKGMLKEIEILIKAIPTLLIVIVSFLIEIILIYIYMSLRNPSYYRSISEYIHMYWNFLAGVSPIVATLLITFFLLLTKRGPQGILHDACEYMEKLTPISALILILNYHLFIFALLIIIREVR